MAGQSWRGRKDQPVEEMALLFAAGRDVLSSPPVDQALALYDIWNTEAHNIMLWRQRIINKSDLGDILAVLQEIRLEILSGGFELNPELEDIHMNIEARALELIGWQSGGKIHTGRSRNDQVACDMRMYLRQQLLERSADTAELVEVLISAARKHVEVIMPGFTHRRPATVTSVGHWLAAHAQALVRDLERFRNAYQLINRCPLGAAAAYGTSWNLNRQLTADLLGFDSVEENTLDCISNRWECETQAATVMAFLMNHCSAFAQDLIFFSMYTGGWIRLPDHFTTGSSIMPQKRNPDFAEIILGKAAVVQGALTTLLGIGRGLPAGYNRETQLTKQTIVTLFEEVRLTPLVLARVAAELQVNTKQAAQAATEGFLNAVDFADFLVQRFGLSFREAYGVTARAIGHCREKGHLTLEAINRELKTLGVKGSMGMDQYRKLNSPQWNLQRRKHLGAPAPKAVGANLRRLRSALKSHQEWLKERRSALQAAQDKISAIRERLME